MSTFTTDNFIKAVFVEKDKKQNLLVGILRDFVGALIFSIVLSAIFWFFSNVMFDADWTYKVILRYLFVGFFILFLLYRIFFYSWIWTLKHFCRQGLRKEFAFKNACDEVKIRPPTFMLRQLAKLILD